ncbi:MAG TPA: DCC1-like thiol-disulfide oxidoreductase family protein [Burkholderiales bacterium]|nr:DCC1-like thiol-disulfide oxidoreductase family protein [Burkholderiales bacterium]
MTNQWTGGQYAIFRFLLGAYLAIHFTHLLPWGGELFSSAGMLANAHASPLLELFPSVLRLYDAPWVVSCLLALGTLAGMALAVGTHDRVAAVVAWYVLACLFTRDPLIANPGLPYLGWMLLAHVVMPKPALDWKMPRPIYFAAWAVLALSYSYSGYTKLLSPSWVAGDTLAFVLQNPLARDYFLREWALALPESALRLVTWAILYVELFFALLVLSRRVRPVAWATMLTAQFGFLFLLNFPDLTTPMLLFHLLTFDPAWLKARRAAATETIFYDGTCGFCHRVVRFTLAENPDARFQFAPLQGAHFAAALSDKVRAALPDSFVVVTEDGLVLLKSEAVIHLLQRLGGLWLPAAWLLASLPRALRDAGYDIVGRARQRLYRRPASLCPIVTPALRRRFIV